MNNIISDEEIKNLNGRFDDVHEVIEEVERIIGLYNKVVYDKDEAEDYFREIYDKGEDKRIELYSNTLQTFIVELKEIEPSGNSNTWWLPQVEISIYEYALDPASVDYAYSVSGRDYEG
jgi:hypothetical protein